MAKSRKKKGTQLSLNMFRDERIPKLIGVMCLLIAFYLFIAFTSYLFTWEADQDKVHNWTWQELRDGGFEIENWLGRLGAIVSDGFINWFLGIPSYLFIYILGVFGISLIKRRPFNVYWPSIRNAFIITFALSILLGFLFSSAQFQWGGAIGKGIADWIVGFVGKAGMIALLIALFVGLIIWTFDPDLDEMTFSSAYTDSRGWLSDLFSGRLRKRQQRKAAAEKRASSLRPKEKELPPAPPTQEFEIVTDADVNPAQASSPTTEDKPLTKGEQLALELAKKKKEKPKPLRVGDSTLEIETPTESVEPAQTLESSSVLPPSLELQAQNTDHSEPYDPTLDLSSYEHPVLPLLEEYAEHKVEIDRAELEANKDQIIETLLNYKIEITKIKATIGPTVTLYEIVPAPGVRISKIKNLEDDIALNLAALGIRIIAPIPGKGTIGIEVPNKAKQIVSLKEVLRHEKFKRAKMDLPIALGKTISNEVFVVDLAKMPHLLIAGATGQGKSVGINTILMSLLYKKHPSQVKLVLIDPKKVELFPYSKLENHFLAYLPGLDEPIVTDTTKVVHTLNSLIIEMEQRYDLLKKAHARNIKEYNKKFVARKLNPEKGHRFMPFIVLVIDEFADLIMTAGKEVEHPIGRLAQLARAIGIHLIIATQRPSVNIITGVIKANFPARIAFKVTAKVDSRTILDTGGADQLIGRGDMLLSYGSDLLRLQCAFVDTPEVERVIDFIGDQQGFAIPYFLPEFHGDDEVGAKSGFKLSELDDNFEEAARLVVSNQHGSTSMIQRRLKLGYNRAGRIMDQLEALGIVGPSEGSKAREVLIYDEVELERYLKDIKSRK